LLVEVTGSTVDHVADHGLALEEVLAREILARF